jgi:prolipoprotein diacylglyceryl transferase
MNWQVDPVIFSIFGFELRWYSLLFLTGLMGGYLIVKKIYAAEGKDVVAVEPLFTYIFIGTVVGMRLVHCLFYEPDYYLANPIEILRIDKGGYASHGGFTGVIIALILYTRKFKDIGFFWLADRVAIAAMFCAGCIRVGNFFNSEIYGHPTTMPWGVTFALQDSAVRHPTQLYEAFGYFAISAILYAVYRKADRAPKTGQLFGLVLTMGFAWRFFVEFFKEDQVPFEAGMVLNMGQLLSVPFILIGIFFVIKKSDNLQA